jgi:hypothetical protein
MKLTTMEKQKNGFLVVLAHKEDLLASVRCSSGWEETAFFNGVEIQSEASLHWMVTAVEELTENCVGWGTGTVLEPRRRETSAIGSRYQRTGADSRLRRLSAFCSELHSEWNSDRTRFNCSYDFRVNNKFDCQSKPRLCCNVNEKVTFLD